MAEHINKSVRAWVLTILMMMISVNLLPAQEKPSPEKIRIAVATSSLAFLVPFVATGRAFEAKLEIVVHDTRWIESSCPRLTNLLRTFGHAITLYKTGVEARGVENRRSRPRHASPTRCTRPA